jgi:hypothetical protein
MSLPSHSITTSPQTGTTVLKVRRNLFNLY